MSVVLVVDDSAATRSLLGEICVMGGVDTVESAASGFEALRALPRLAELSLVITDVNMPDITGLELVRMIRDQARFKSTPIFVISSEAADRDGERALAAGAARYFTKPFDAAALAKAISEAIR